jgi:hypothetical protein
VRCCENNLIPAVENRDTNHRIKPRRNGALVIYFGDSYMRPTKTETKINNYKLIKLKSRHYEIIVKRPVIKDAEQTKEFMSQVQKASR